MNIDEISNAKEKMEKIISRIVVDESVKINLIYILYADKNIFPIKAILKKFDETEILPLSNEEKSQLNDLTAVYI